MSEHATAVVVERPAFGLNQPQQHDYQRAPQPDGHGSDEHQAADEAAGAPVVVDDGVGFNRLQSATLLLAIAIPQVVWIVALMYGTARMGSAITGVF